MIEAEVLADKLQEVAKRVRSEGPVTWERVSDWEVLNPPAFREPLDDDQDAEMRVSRSDLEEEKRKGEALAARYKRELSTLTSRLAADLTRLTNIIGICCPPNPQALQSMEKLAAQVAADGCCPSCWRDGQRLVEIEKRPNGTPYYRGLCRWCGGWKGAHGSLPPTWVVVKHHRRTLNAMDVEKATGKVA